MRVSVLSSPRSALALAAVATLFVASACTSSDDEESGGDADLSVLGEAQKATGSAVKVGLVTDGGVAGQTGDPSADMARATVKYLNEYKNGLNGHEIELVDCETGNVPSGATSCGAQMVEEQVIAALMPVSAQDLSVFAAMKGSGVPLVVLTSAVPDIEQDPNAFILSNPLAAFTAITTVAAENDLKTVGIPIIDVPAATGPVKELLEGPLEEAGLDLVFTPIPPSAADQTPQIVQMIDAGVDLFVPVGTATFVAGSLKAIKQNGFTGPVIIGQSPITDDFVAAVPGGLEGVINVGGNTEDPEDADVKLFAAIGEQYDVQNAADAPPLGFQTVLTLARAVEGLEGDLTSATVSQAFSGMSEPVLKPMGGGIELQCGQELNPDKPAQCTLQGVQSVLDQAGKATSWDVFG